MSIPQSNSDSLSTDFSLFQYESDQSSASPLFSSEKLQSFNTEAWFDCPVYSEAKQKMMLEVVTLWNGQLTDILHLTQPRRLTLGNSPRADLSFPIESLASLSEEEAFSTSLVDVTGRDFLLCLEPELQGHIEHNGETFTPLELIEAGRAHQIDGSPWFSYPLVPGVRATFQIEALELHVNFVPAATQPLPRLSLHSLLFPLGSLSVLLFLLGTFCFAVPGLFGKHELLPQVNAASQQRLLFPTRNNEVQVKTIHVCAPVRRLTPTPAEGKHNAHCPPSQKSHP